MLTMVLALHFSFSAFRFYLQVGNLTTPKFTDSLSPKGELLKELTEGSHSFECTLLLCLIRLVLETEVVIFSFRGGNPSF